ncbi:hypothetical protein M2196_002113 [Bradyrhizobium elkanii]|nr:hypothetical protein [Bradyrhizobium elkanii]
MNADRDAAPDDVAALKEALAAERMKGFEIAAELAVARAKASEDEALIAQQKLQIAKLKHQIYGQRSERSARLIEQLALTLSWKPTPPRTSLRRNGPWPRRRRCADLRASAPSARRSPKIFPGSGW